MARSTYLSSPSLLRKKLRPILFRRNEQPRRLVRAAEAQNLV